MLQYKKIKSACVTAIAVFSGLAFSTVTAVAQDSTAKEDYRPQYHFSPKAHWMNDPNGLVYLNGKYHLFFQHNPGGTTWGPMHWGHAVSTDLFHWQELPIALYPDSLGMIFSGSAVVDVNNTAGFGKNALVAIFTYHNPQIENAKTGLHQYQGIAYSNDEGKTWTKYSGNPVLPNPGIQDFRDPKVSWNEASQQWVMTLATRQSVTFYGSRNLKSWTRLSEFGNKLGAHGGVWECPDLFSLNYNGVKKWVLLVSINPGGPNGGSATQYFIGNFDGKTFTPENTATRWIDYGADNYAGVTFANTGNRRLFIGWMNNWLYANQVPTQAWRGAATLPRELHLARNGTQLVLTSRPAEELNRLAAPATRITTGRSTVKGSAALFTTKIAAPFKLSLSGPDLKDFTITLKNRLGDQFVFGYDATRRLYYTDRSLSGLAGFHPEFAKVHHAPRISTKRNWRADLIIDAASVEIFADGGMTNFTEICFPREPYSSVHLSSKNLQLDGVSLTPLQLIQRK